MQTVVTEVQEKQDLTLNARCQSLERADSFICLQLLFKEVNILLHPSEIDRYSFTHNWDWGSTSKTQKIYLKNTYQGNSNVACVSERTSGGRNISNKHQSWRDV